MEGDGFSLFLDLVGSGRGPGARVRRWSAIVFILMLVMGGIAVYIWIRTVPTKIDVADVGADTGLPINRRSVGVRNLYSIPYEIKGRLVHSEAVTIGRRGERWTFAPLVPESAGSAENPRVYFGATEASYKRSRTENRFAGYLERDDYFGSVRKRLEEAGLSAPSDAYFLKDNGALRAGADSAISLMVLAFVGGLASLAFFFMAARRARDDDDAAGRSI